MPTRTACSPRVGSASVPGQANRVAAAARPEMAQEAAPLRRRKPCQSSAVIGRKASIAACQLVSCAAPSRIRRRMALRHQAAPRQRDDRAVEGARVHREREVHRRQPGADDQHGLAGPQAGGRPGRSGIVKPGAGVRLAVRQAAAGADNGDGGQLAPAGAGRPPSVRVEDHAANVIRAKAPAPAGLGHLVVKQGMQAPR